MILTQTKQERSAKNKSHPILVKILLTWQERIDCRKRRRHTLVWMDEWLVREDEKRVVTMTLKFRLSIQ